MSPRIHGSRWALAAAVVLFASAASCGPDPLHAVLTPQTSPPAARVTPTRDEAMTIPEGVVIEYWVQAAHEDGRLEKNIKDEDIVLVSRDPSILGVARAKRSEEDRSLWFVWGIRPGAARIAVTFRRREAVPVDVDVLSQIETHEDAGTPEAGAPGPDGGDAAADGSGPDAGGEADAGVD